MRVREQCGATERRRDGKIEALGEADEIIDRRLRPSAATQNCDRRAGGMQTFLQIQKLDLPRPGQRRLYTHRVGDIGFLHEHVFRQRDHHRARPALHRGMEGARDDFRNARRIVDFGDEFCRRAEDGAIVHLLECAALAHAALDLADEEDQRRRIVLGDMDRMGGVHRARSACHEGDARPPGQAAGCFRHQRRARFLPRDGELDRDIMQRVEHGEIGFAGHAEHMLDALRHELIDENLPARAQVGARHGLNRRC